MNYRGYIIKASGVLGPKCYSIVTEGRGGKIPAMMEGMFTSPGICKQMIDMYLETKEGNAKSNDKESSKG